jgi:hypothetical protein
MYSLRVTYSFLNHRVVYCVYVEFKFKVNSAQAGDFWSSRFYTKLSHLGIDDFGTEAKNQYFFYQLAPFWAYMYAYNVFLEKCQSFCLFMNV